MTKPTCAKCGSENIFFQTDTQWDSARQAFRFSVIVYDDVDCMDCDHAAPAEWSDGEPLEADVVAPIKMTDVLGYERHNRGESK